MVSADALWVKKYMESGLIEPFDLASICASSELYSMAKNFDFLNDPKGALGYPFSWSTVQIYYNPDKIKTPPTSWESLTDPMYKGLIVAENIPTDLMAIAGIATGSKSPYAQTPDQISSASNFLAALKPNMVKLASQNNEIVTMMASGEAAIGISNLGTDVRVKDAGGPEIKSAYPPEGTIGFIDSEMITAKGSEQTAGQAIPGCDAEIRVDRGELHHELAPAVQRDGGQGSDERSEDSRQRQEALHGRPGEGAGDDPQGAGAGPAGLHRGVQQGLRGVT